MGYLLGMDEAINRGPKPEIVNGQKVVRVGTEYTLELIARTLACVADELHDLNRHLGTYSEKDSDDD